MPRVARELSVSAGGKCRRGVGPVPAPRGVPGDHTQCAASCLPARPLLGGLAHVYYRNSIINKG